MAPNLNNIIAALDAHDCKPQKNGSGYKARCPAHDDANPSLSVSEGAGGKVLLKCHAGCSYEVIAGKLGIQRGGMNIAAEYDYTDEAGKLLYQVVRTEPKGFRQRKPDGAGGWDWKLGSVRRVLFHLPEVAELDDDAWVFVVEGEKDVLTLARHGIVATCNPGGAGKWSKVDDSPLHRLRVAVIADKDEPGRKHANEVCASLVGKAVDVRLLEVPQGKDVSDWLARDGTPAALHALVQAAPTWTSAPASVIVSESRSAAVDGATVLSQRERDVQAWSIKPASALVGGGTFDWVWECFAARRYTTMLSGYWKCGKSTLLLHVVRAMERGGVVGTEVHAGRVLVVTEESEDGWARRRDDFDLGDHCDFIIRPFRGRPSQRQWEALAEYIARAVRAKNYACVVIDTLAAVSPSEDENGSAEMTLALKPFNLIAEAGAAVLVIHHSRKEQGTRYTSARGSGAIAAFFDQLVTFAPMEPENPHDRRRVLSVVGRLPEGQPEIVIELAIDGSTYTTVGTKAAAKREDRQAVIDGLLAKSTIAMTAKAIHAAWPEGCEIPRPTARTIADDLAAGETGDDARYVGAVAPASGGRGGRSTRAYRLSQSNLRLIKGGAHIGLQSETPPLIGADCFDSGGGA
jgi:hypothetical protein